MAVKKQFVVKVFVGTVKRGTLQSAEFVTARTKNEAIDATWARLEKELFERHDGKLDPAEIDALCHGTYSIACDLANALSAAGYQTADVRAAKRAEARKKAAAKKAAAKKAADGRKTAVARKAA